MKRPKTIIIAEAGVNHNGSVEIAEKLIEEAAASGCDYVKFQTFHTEKLVSGDCSTATYQKENCGASSQYEMLKKLELSENDFLRLKNCCKDKGIGFLSTPFDIESLTFISSLNPDYIKVPSGELTNLPYLRMIAQTGIPVIISTGMSDPEDIEKALVPFYEGGYDNKKIILLHCTTQYPTPMKDVNLLAMKGLQKRFGIPTGYSDHTRGVEIPVAAVALGAVAIEKHFTLSRKMDGPDHAASLEPHELREMVKMVRNVESALGNEEKTCVESERENLKIARKSLVATTVIKKGEILSEKNMTAKRPGTGLSPMYWDTIAGTRAIRDFNPDEQIEI